MAEAVKRDVFDVRRIQSGGWGLYEIKRSMTLPVAVFGSGDNEIADRVCFFLNTGLTEEELLDIDPNDESEEGESKGKNVDEFLHEIARRG